MANYTKNNNLILPLPSENYSIEVANTNNTIIDNELEKRVEKVANKGLSTNDFTNNYKGMLDELVRYEDIQVHDDVKIDIVGLKANKADRKELENTNEKVNELSIEINNISKTHVGTNITAETIERYRKNK